MSYIASAPSSLVRISAWRDAKDKLHKEMLSQETFPQYLIKLEAQAQRYRIVLKVRDGGMQSPLFYDGLAISMLGP